MSRLCVRCDEDVSFQEYGLSSPIVAAHVVLESIFVLLYLALYFYSRSCIARIYLPQMPRLIPFTRIVGNVAWIDYVRGRDISTRLGQKTAVFMAVIATSIYTVVVAVSEAYDTLKGAFMIVFPIVTFFTVIMELRVVQVVQNYLQVRHNVFYGGNPGGMRWAFSLLDLFTDFFLPLLALARVISHVVYTVIDLNPGLDVDERVNGVVWFALTVTALVIYVVVGISFVALGTNLYRATKHEKIQSRIPLFLLVSAVWYALWAISNLAHTLGTAFGRPSTQYGGLVSRPFAYDLPNFLALLFLSLAGSQGGQWGWFIDRREKEDYGPGQIAYARGAVEHDDDDGDGKSY